MQYRKKHYPMPNLPTDIDESWQRAKMAEDRREFEMERGDYLRDKAKDEKAEMEYFKKKNQK
jgi:hypothetical protein